MIISKKIFVKGVVQGVGFRPSVYKLATLLNMRGYVLNSGEGVEIEIEGEEESVERFIELLRPKSPPLSKIDSIEILDSRVKNRKRFEILNSKENTKSTKISPDIAVCEECLREMRDKKNRRYGYALINCTNCGPRYTIIKTLPYDRKNTSMQRFDMCEECKKEYNDPLNRRYHAQPIGCFKCGPKLSLYIKNRKVNLPQQDIIKRTASLLNDGKIVAIKGLGGFHLVCSGVDDDTVVSLRKRKGRPSKPFGVMVKDVEMAKSLGYISEREVELLSSNIRPILLIKSRPDSPLSPLVAPNIDKVGVMLPYTPIHHLLWDYLEEPLIVTSANISNEPIIGDSKELQKRLGSVIDALLNYDREIVNGCDDSVVQMVADNPVWLRVARGIAPLSINISDNPSEKFKKKVLSVGANQKNSVSIAFDNQIVTSPHIGDLETISSISYFEKSISTLKNFYQFEEDMIISDKHPNYESSKWAERERRKGKETKKIQHHYSHALAVLAEHRYRGDVLAFVWDGTGLGDDSKVWGGEILLVNRNGFERVGHLREFRLLGAERAIKEPKRVALGILFEIFSLDEVLSLNSHTLRAFRPFEIEILYKSWYKGINSPYTTSIGRLFDGVASLCGVCQTVTYEGESGLLLEAISTNRDCGDSRVKRSTETDSFGLEIKDGVIDWKKFILDIMNLQKEEVANYLIESLSNVVVSFSESEKYIDLPIVLAGGVWQNGTLLDMTLRELKLKERVVLLPKDAPMNDGAVSIGQAYHSFHHFLDPFDS
jgi:hydrogenase maturation protein HypF